MHESVRLDPDQALHIYGTWFGSKLFSKAIIIYVIILQHIYALLKTKVLKWIANVRIHSCFFVNKKLETEWKTKKR